MSRRASATLTLLVALLIALHGRGATAQSAEPACVAGFDESLASLDWNETNWRAHFGRPLKARATTTIAGQERMRLRFFHFGRADGAPLVLLMGHGQSMLSWDPLLLARYAACFDVYLIDHLGIGRSAFRGRPARVEAALQGLEFTQMADWVFDAVQAIRASAHCARERNRCNIVGRAPHLAGWAMGGKVAGVAAERHPDAFGDILNLGGNIGRSDDLSDDYPLGPNPDAAHLVESDDITLAGYTAFFVDGAVWGSAAASAAANALLSAGLRLLPHYNANPAGVATTAQKAEQARATAASVNQLEAIANRVLLAYGRQDDFNFCYTGELVPSVCARLDRQGYACEAAGVSGCRWGLAPLSDYFGTSHSAYERLAAGVSREVCLRSFEGAHGFPGQSQRAVLAAVVDFVNRDTSGDDWGCATGALAAAE
jgi:pimeloyl-ACP methyl ester carboxylesterase